MARSSTGGTYTASMGSGRSYTGSWDFVPRTSSRRETLARLEWLATLLDTAFVVPGTKIRFGFDALVGLVPGIGDALTTAVSLWIVHEAHKLSAPRELIARMIGNVALDGLVGAMPVFGDVFDVMWRSNRRNMRLLRAWMEREGLV